MSNEPKLIDDGEDTVAIYNGESMVVEKGEVKYFDGDEEVVFATQNGVTVVPRDEDGWLVMSGDEPDRVAEFIREHEKERLGETDYSGLPGEFDVGFTRENALFDSAWRDEIVRPGSEVGQMLEDDPLQTVTLTIRITENMEMKVVDIDFWPSRTDVEMDL